MTGGGPWDPGEWTDDTAMALCLAESIGSHGVPLNLDDLAGRYGAWAAGGPKDIGVITRASLTRVRNAEDAMSQARALHEHTGKTAGNGTVMRIAPLAAVSGSDEEIAVAARADARLTHWDAVAGDASAALCAALRAIGAGADPLTAARAEQGDHPKLLAALDLVEAGNLDAIGLLIEGREGATCWAGLAAGMASLSFSSFEDGVGWAITHGFDTDTNGAIAGALLAARDGVETIPERWLDALMDRERLETAAEGIE